MKNTHETLVAAVREAINAAQSGEPGLIDPAIIYDHGVGGYIYGSMAAHQPELGDIMLDLADTSLLTHETRERIQKLIGDLDDSDFADEAILDSLTRVIADYLHWGCSDTLQMWHTKRDNERN